LRFRAPDRRALSIPPLLRRRASGSHEQRLARHKPWHAIRSHRGKRRHANSARRVDRGSCSQAQRRFFVCWPSLFPISRPQTPAAAAAAEAHTSSTRAFFAQRPRRHLRWPGRERDRLVGPVQAGIVPAHRHGPLDAGGREFAECRGVIVDARPPLQMVELLLPPLRPRISQISPHAHARKCRPNPRVRQAARCCGPAAAAMSQVARATG
jgi:hypothetical protein